MKPARSPASRRAQAVAGEGVAPHNAARSATPPSAARQPGRHDDGVAEMHADPSTLRLWLRLLACSTQIETEIRRRLRRHFGTTLPRFGYTVPVDTAAMHVERRVSATYKDLPGGQILGPTFDYTHRLLDPELAGNIEPPEPVRREPDGGHVMRVSDIIAEEGMIEPDGEMPDDHAVGDLTREPLDFPIDRDLRLQALSRGDEGFLLALGYSTQRGYARSHPFVGEVRIGEVEVELKVPELGFAVPLGRIRVTECQMVNQFKGSAKAPPQFTRGYGLVFGQSERKAMAMSLCDRALRARELGEDLTAPAQDEEFVISHCDNVQATGFVEHLKLPHYVDFQAELDLVRRMRREYGEARGAPERKEAAE